MPVTSTWSQSVSMLQSVLKSKPYRRACRLRGVVMVALLFVLIYASLYTRLHPDRHGIQEESEYTFDAGSDLSKEKKTLVLAKTKTEPIAWVMKVAERL